MTQPVGTTRTSSGVVVYWYGLQSADAPTLFLLHGRKESGRCWPDAVRRWGSKYRIAAWDARSHGESARYTAAELKGNDPIRIMYDDAVGILEEISGGSAVLVVGHSMGGGIAAALAAWQPRLVRAAVLEDPAWSRADWDQRLRAGAEAVVLAAAFRKDMDAEIGKARMQHPSWPDAEFRPWAQARIDCDDTFVASGHGVLSDPWVSIAKAISVPTLVVAGTIKPIVDDQTQREIADLENPCLSVAVVEGAGHTVRRDRTDAFHALVDPWLDGRSR